MTKLLLVMAGTAVMFLLTVVPMLLLEAEEESNGSGRSSGIAGIVDGAGGTTTSTTGDNHHHHHSLHDVVSYSKQVKEGLAKAAADASRGAKVAGDTGDAAGGVRGGRHATDDNNKPEFEDGGPDNDVEDKEKSEPVKQHHQHQQQQTQTQQQLARGVAGLPMSQTPALVGARPGHIECDVDVDDMAYWNDPQGTRDQNFVSPFKTHPESKVDLTKKRYLTFEPDPGGWNNIRMSMEIIFVIAATTGRTLVLPPKAPFYLLGMGKENARSFGSFYHLAHPAFQKEVEVISMSEFLQREKNGVLQLGNDTAKVQQLTPVADLCVYKTDSDVHCDFIFKHLRSIGYQPQLDAQKFCYIFDRDVFVGGTPSDETKEKVRRFCGEKGQGVGERKVVYYDKTTHDQQLIHWQAADVDKYRLLNHFYSFLLFTDQAVDNHYKRFVRDFLHYKDVLYCSAGKVVHALNAEGKEWSTLHVRRGDLQYKAVKISAEEWYENLKEVWNPGEILYIATDERNKTFFDPIRQYHELRFLDDYWDSASLGDLDPYWLGMVDTIVASHGRTFSGTVSPWRMYFGGPLRG
jgi:hypothetical protein